MNKHSVPSRPAAFASPEAMPGALSAATAAAVLAAVGDIAFILDADGTVLDVAVPPGELETLDPARVIGQPWSETVTVESRPKLVEMLADARDPKAVARWRQVNHPAAAEGAGGDIPVRYMTMALDGGDRIIAIGRDMRAVAVIQQRLLQTQQALERDYIRLRQAELRYRLLFDVAAEAVLIVDAESRRIREANPAAHRLLDAEQDALVGTSVHGIIEPEGRDDFIAYLGAAEAADEVAPLAVRLSGQSGEARITARLFRQARTPLLLLRITPAGTAPASDGPGHDAALSDVIERMPDAFVLVDDDLTILTANAAFVELAGLPSADRAIGAKLGNWLGRPGIDLELIVAQMREHGTVRNVATILRDAGGAQEEIEVSGVIAPMCAGSGSGDCFGFTIRNVARRLRAAPIQPHATPRSVEQLTELVGRMSLKEIVRESTDLIERLCIEAALAYTSDNRASAAEILGVSRQSLYSKLHRHGLGNLVSGDD